MLKKSSYEEPELARMQPSEKSSPTIIKASVIEDEESPVTIAAKNEDMPQVQPENESVFGSTLVFKGHLSADEEILIQGTVEGTIAHHKKNVTVGKQGRVSALIHANSVTIQGRVIGDIHAIAATIDSSLTVTMPAQRSWRMGKVREPRFVRRPSAMVRGSTDGTMRPSRSER